MKKVVLFFILFNTILTYSQNDSTLIIDNVNTRVSLPYWLKAGQTIDLGTNTKLVSIIEFSISNNNLTFSQAISLTNAQTVPANKVWKIEGIGSAALNTVSPSSIGLSSSSSSTSSTSNLPTIFQSPKKFETVGTYNWIVPTGVTSICVEVWGAGGGGNLSFSNGAGTGGAGGGYSYQCFTVVPNTNYFITIGSGGSGGNGTSTSGGVGGTSSFGNLISASGGSGGDNNVVGTGNYINGGYASGGNGGNGGNGGVGGSQGYINYSNNNAVIGAGYGQIPGGGGGGGVSGRIGGDGARGQVYIYW